MASTPLLLNLSQMQGRFSVHRLLVHTLGLTMMLALSSYCAWDSWAFWKVSYGHPLLLLSSFAYICGAEVVSRLRCLPRAEGLGLIFLSMSIAFLALMAIITFGRFYYSRSFLFAAYLSSILSLFLIYRFASRDRNLRIAVIPGGMAEDLMELKGVEWVLLQVPEVSRPINGVAVDLHQKLTPDWVRFVSDCSLKRIPVYHSAVVFEAATGRVSLSHLSAGLLDEFQLAPFYSAFKRGVDLLLVVLSSPVILPLVILTALAVKIGSPGPVLFCQMRVGQSGEPFCMLKFRSMITNVDSAEAAFACSQDARVTRVGRFIRKYRLDELPQLWNVLRGEMSLIGPRPEQIDFVRQFEKEIPFYGYRHLVKPGLTGWAQVTQGYAADVDQTRRKLEHDLYYIKYVSFWLDFWVILKTLRTVLTGFGAR